jgi:hypothetical protein
MAHARQDDFSIEQDFPILFVASWRDNVSPNLKSALHGANEGRGIFFRRCRCGVLLLVGQLSEAVPFSS